MVVTEPTIRIAIVVPRIVNLGPVIVMQNLVNSLFDKANFSIKVFYLDSNVDSDILISVPVERFNRKKFRFADFDIIHTNGFRPDLFAFLNRNRIKYHISTIHNFVFEDLFYTYNSFVSWFFGNIWLLLWRRADKLVCVSDTMKSYYEKWFSTAKLEVIYNGISEPDKSIFPDSDIIQSINNFHSKGLRVLGCAGVLTRRKGIDQILHMVASDDRLAAVILGDGRELSALQQLSETLNISDRCEFCGFRRNAVVYFRYFDFFIIPSKSEGFGLALIEAIQQRIPVICSDIAVFKELFREDEVTFFKTGDQGSLSDAFKMAAEKSHENAERAHSTYENNYTASLMARHYYELYKSA